MAWELKPTDVLGFLGGIVLASGLVPQVWHTFRRKSAEDISLTWQFFYLGGLSMLNGYFIITENYPVLVPGIFETAMIVLLIIMKFWYASKTHKSSADPSDSVSGVNESKLDSACEDNLSNESAKYVVV